MFFSRYGTEILIRTGEHIIIVAIAIVIACLIGIPLGIVATRKPRLAQPILGIANVIQTVPSLAVFGFLLSLPFLGGIGKTPAIIALILYALLPLIRNTYTGITAISPAIVEAGRGMGMTDKQLLLQVEIPLALNVILAGIRVATVISVGVATVAAAIGGGGLGVFIFRGIATVNNELILAGAIPAALIAIVADLGLGWLERRLQPQATDKSKVNRRWIIVTGVVLITLVAGIGSYWLNAAVNTITIGSKNFTEQVILGEILAQQIENNTDLKVQRNFNLGGTFIAHEATVEGELAGYVEYTGTAYTAILKQQPIGDPEAVYQQVKQAYEQQFNLEVMPPLGFENTFAIVVRKEDADRYNLKTIADAAPYTSNWQAGFGYEFLNREDGYPGLAKAYGLNFSQPPQAMEIGLMYKALSEKQVDLVAGNSTDGLIPVLDLVVLEDNKKYFPPYQAVPIFNQEVLETYPQIKEAVEQLSGQITAEQMQQLNYLVDNQSQSVKQVVKEFLRELN